MGPSESDERSGTPVSKLKRYVKPGLVAVTGKSTPRRAILSSVGVTFSTNSPCVGKPLVSMKRCSLSANVRAMSTEGEPNSKTAPRRRTAARRFIEGALYRSVSRCQTSAWLLSSATRPLPVPSAPASLRGSGAEPPRLGRRLHDLRGWSHGTTERILTGGAGAGGAAGVGAAGRARLAMGGDRIDRGEDRVYGRDAAEVGAAA